MSNFKHTHQGFNWTATSLTSFDLWWKNRATGKPTSRRSRRGTKIMEPRRWQGTSWRTSTSSGKMPRLKLIAFSGRNTWSCVKPKRLRALLFTAKPPEFLRRQAPVMRNAHAVYQKLQPKSTWSWWRDASVRGADRYCRRRRRVGVRKHKGGGNANFSVNLLQTMATNCVRLTSLTSRLQHVLRGHVFKKETPDRRRLSFGRKRLLHRPVDFFVTQLKKIERWTSLLSGRVSLPGNASLSRMTCSWLYLAATRRGKEQVIFVHSNLPCNGSAGTAGSFSAGALRRRYHL